MRKKIVNHYNKLKKRPFYFVAYVLIALLIVIFFSRYLASVALSRQTQAAAMLHVKVLNAKETAKETAKAVKEAAKAVKEADKAVKEADKADKEQAKKATKKAQEQRKFDAAVNQFSKELKTAAKLEEKSDLKEQKLFEAAARKFAADQKKMDHLSERALRNQATAEFISNNTNDAVFIPFLGWVSA